VSTRTTCLHCGQTILRRSDGIWFSNPVGDPHLGYRCDPAPNLQHAPAPADADDRITSAFGHALVGAMRAEAILNQGHEHAASKRNELSKAAKNLTAYLAELER
jgi:hypothetical protein